MTHPHETKGEPVRDYILAFKIIDGKVTIKAKAFDPDAETTFTIDLPLADLKFIAKHDHADEWTVVP